MFPDITVFGQYTYLVTELVWGCVALALLWYADGLRRAARTVAVLYPFAFAWDWYTLHVGVFAIRLRTGLDLLGIPIEEHLFMLVVPALVLGIHETLRKHRASRAGRPTGPDSEY
ncbi:MAG: lycopene cyclase domain-containing protein [Haloarculaceae archaeon]